MTSKKEKIILILLIIMFLLSWFSSSFGMTALKYYDIDNHLCTVYAAISIVLLTLDIVLCILTIGIFIFYRKE